MVVIEYGVGFCPDNEVGVNSLTEFHASSTLKEELSIEVKEEFSNITR